MKERYVIFKKNGEIKKLVYQDANKYEIYALLRQELITHNSFIFLVNGEEKIETWKGCLLIPEEYTKEQQEKVQAILDTYEYMKSFISESFHIIYPFKGNSETYFKPNFKPLYHFQQGAIEDFINSHIVVFFNNENNPDFFYIDDDVFFSENDYLQGLNKISHASVHFQTLNEWLRYFITKGCFVTIDDLEDPDFLNLYLPNQLGYYQRSMLFQSIESRINYNFFSKIFIEENGCFTQIASEPSFEELCSLLNFSSNPEETLALKKKNL